MAFWHGRKGWGCERNFCEDNKHDKRFQTMLTRLYADNFRCLTNFELKLDRLNLLMGPNGCGKTSVFDVLRRIQQFMAGDCKIQQAFPFRELTRWQSRMEQRFEIDLQIGNDCLLHYILAVEHQDGGSKCRVKEESLSEDGKPLFSFKMGEVHLFRDNHSAGPVYPYDWTLPALAGVQSAHDNKKLTAFRKHVANFVIAGISPSQMETESRSEAARLSPRMENFVSWYRRLAQENLGSMLELFSELKHVLPGFSSFSLKDIGEDAKGLKVLFDPPEKNQKTLTYDLGELSDGQRVLIALYTLIHGLKGEGLTLFLDEPDNYVALSEIQPWLSTLNDACGESFEQAVIISHHPEIIDYLGASKGRWFNRPTNTAVRVSDAPPKSVDGLELSQTIARGWEDEG